MYENGEMTMLHLVVETGIKIGRRAKNSNNF